MMFYYWTTKGIRPSTFYAMPKGELMVLRAFYEREIDDKVKNVRKMREGGVNCPYMMGGV